MDDYISSITDYFSTLTQSITVSEPSMDTIVVLCMAAGLLLLSGLASGSEIAFFSLAPADIDKLKHSSTATDEHIRQMREDNERTLATILITNNFVNVTIIMLCNYAIARTVDFHGNTTMEFIVVTVLLTFILLLFGEIMPKILATQSKLLFCRLAVGGIRFFGVVFRPIANLLLKSSVVADKLVSENTHVISVDELGQALEMTNTKDIAEEKKILEGILHFAAETANSILTPRKDIVGIDIKMRFNDVIALINENKYSRMPVFSESKDDIRGIIYVKDLLPHLSQPDDFAWQTLMRPPFFVPETKKIDDLFREFQSNKVHIAIVVDEFGGTSGLVTMEDIMEEIVGDINDEFDENN